MAEIDETVRRYVEGKTAKELLEFKAWAIANGQMSDATKKAIDHGLAIKRLKARDT